MKYVPFAIANMNSKNFSLKKMIWYFVMIIALLQRLLDTNMIPLRGVCLLTLDKLALNLCFYQFFWKSKARKLSWYSVWSCRILQRAMGFNMSLRGACLRLSLRLLSWKFLGSKRREWFHQDISIMKSGTKASGVPVCWLIIAGH